MLSINLRSAFQNHGSPSTSPINKKTSPQSNQSTNFQLQFFKEIQNPIFDSSKLKPLLLKSGRTPKDARLIYEELKSFDFFTENQNLAGQSEENLLRICREIKYRFFEKRTIIYKENDLSDGYLYIILSGEVSLEHTTHSSIPNPKVKRLIKNLSSRNLTSKNPSEFSNPSDSPLTRDTNRKQTFNQERLILRLAETNAMSPSNRNKLNRQASFAEQAEEVCKDVKQAGNHFGENMLSSTSKRTEDAVALTNCEVLMIHRDQLDQIRSENHMREEAKFNFLLTHMPGLDEIRSFESISMLLKLFKPLKLKKGEQLTCEGKEGFFFYLIKEGEFEVFKKVRTEVGSYHHFDSKHLEKKFGLEKYKDEEVKIFTVTPGSFIGEEIVFRQYGKYEYSSKVSSHEATVYELDRAKFAFRFPEVVFKSLCEHHENKMKQNSSLFQEKLEFFIHEYNFLHSKKMLSSPRESHYDIFSDPKDSKVYMLPPIDPFRTPKVSNTGRLTPSMSQPALSKPTEEKEKFLKNPEFIHYYPNRNALGYCKVQNPKIMAKLRQLDIRDIDSYRFNFDKEEKRSPKTSKSTLNKKPHPKLSPLLTKPKAEKSLVIPEGLERNHRGSVELHDNQESNFWFQTAWLSPKASVGQLISQSEFQSPKRMSSDSISDTESDNEKVVTNTVNAKLEKFYANRRVLKPCTINGIFDRKL